MLPRAHVLHLASRVGMLAWPVIVTNVLQSLVNVADPWMVGRLGPIEIAAVGMGNAVRMLVLVFVLAVTTGSMALAAQARGAGDDAELHTVARQSILLAVLLAAVLSVTGLLLAGPLPAFLNHGGDPRATELGRTFGYPRTGDAWGVRYLTALGEVHVRFDAGTVVTRGEDIVSRARRT